MNNFHVVDLAVQAEHIARYVKGWPKAAVLEWLAQFGQVSISYRDADVYYFRAYSGIATGFVWRDSGEFLIIGDHHVWMIESD